jgi:hypothetical protein
VSGLYIERPVIALEPEATVLTVFGIINQVDLPIPSRPVNIRIDSGGIPISLVSAGDLVENQAILGDQKLDHAAVSRSGLDWLPGGRFIIGHELSPS